MSNGASQLKVLGLNQIDLQIVWSILRKKLKRINKNKLVYLSKIPTFCLSQCINKNTLIQQSLNDLLISIIFF